MTERNLRGSDSNCGDDDAPPTTRRDTPVGLQPKRTFAEAITIKTTTIPEAEPTTETEPVDKIVSTARDAVRISAKPARPNGDPITHLPLEK